MFQFVISLFLISLFSSCHLSDKGEEKTSSLLSQERQIASQKSTFEFKTVDTGWLRAHPEIYRELQEIIDAERRNLQQVAMQFRRENPRSSLLPFKLDLESLRELNKQDSSVVSVIARVYTYSGGAHGMTYHKSWNYDKNNRRFLSLQDYVRTEAQFRKLKNDIREVIWNNPEIDSSAKNANWFDRGLAHPNDIKAWNIDGDKLVVTFDPYQIAPYSAGWIVVSVPKP